MNEIIAILVMTFAKCGVETEQNRTQACVTGINNGKRFYPIQSLIINFIFKIKQMSLIVNQYSGIY